MCDSSHLLTFIYIYIIRQNLVNLELYYRKNSYNLIQELFINGRSLSKKCAKNLLCSNLYLIIKDIVILSVIGETTKALKFLIWNKLYMIQRREKPLKSLRHEKNHVVCRMKSGKFFSIHVSTRISLWSF